MSCPNFIKAEEMDIRNPTLKTKIKPFSIYVEHTFGFPQLPNAYERADVFGTKTCDSKICPAFTEYLI